MKALSIQQPWAWLIVHGHKDIENRTWPTRFRGQFLIHTGKRHDGAPDDWDWPEIEPPAAFDYGGIIGVAEIAGCYQRHASRWFRGPYGFVIRDARPLPFRSYRGQLGFFEAGAP